MRGTGSFLIHALSALGMGSPFLSLIPAGGPVSRTPTRRVRCSYPMPAACRLIRRDMTHRARQRRHRQARRTTALRRRRMLRQAA